LDLYELNWFTITIRLSLAAIIGGIIGYERGTHNHPAGIRTHMLICVGAALAMISNQFVFYSFNTAVDPTRMGAQVISGIGFLGAGTIINGKNRVRGLTTAAGVWTSACIGLAAGLGFYQGAIASGVIAIIIITLVARISEGTLTRIKTLSMYVDCENIESYKAMVAELEEAKFRVAHVEVNKIRMERTVNVSLVIKLRMKDDYVAIMEKISLAPGVMSIQRI